MNNNDNITLIISAILLLIPEIIHDVRHDPNQQNVIVDGRPPHASPPQRCVTTTQSSLTATTHAQVRFTTYQIRFD